MIPYIKFPLTFNVAAMQREVALFKEEHWVPHFNKGYYEGDWSVIPLRSVNGEAGRIYPDPTATLDYADTVHMERSPYLKEVVSSFDCNKTAVRLLRLKAGSSIKEHRDHALSYEDGEVRLHIPVITNPQLEFYLNKNRMLMEEGSCWYLDFNLPHSVNNPGATDRIHLVIDCVTNEWISQFFPASS